MFNNKGFTLLEILVVLLIMSLLVYNGIPHFQRTIENSEEAVCKNNRETILRAYDRYEFLYGDLTLAEIVNDNNWTKEFEMYEKYEYCPSGGEFYVTEQNEILCSVHDSDLYP